MRVGLHRNGSTPTPTPGILWANLHLLFWLSLVPFVTGWMGENHFAPVPTAIYSAVLSLAALAYWILQRAIVASQGPAFRASDVILRTPGGLR